MTIKSNNLYNKAKTKLTIILFNKTQQIKN